MPLLVVLSMTLAFDLACSTVASDEDEAGVTTNQSSDDNDADSSSSDDEGSTGSTGATTASTSTDTNEDGPVDDDDVPSDDEGVKLDLPLEPDLPFPTGDCSTAWLSWEQLAAVYPDCMIMPDDGQGCWTEPMIGCAPPGPGGCACPDGNCIENWAECSGDALGWGDAVPLEVCGPYVLDGLCCSIGEFTYGCAE